MWLVWQRAGGGWKLITFNREVLVILFLQHHFYLQSLFILKLQKPQKGFKEYQKARTPVIDEIRAIRHPNFMKSIIATLCAACSEILEIIHASSSIQAIFRGCLGTPYAVIWTTHRGANLLGILSKFKDER